MTIKVVRKTECKNENFSNDNEIKIDIKDVLQKMFNICVKIIEIEQLAVDDISDKRIKEITSFSNEEYDEEIAKLEKFINIYSLIFGKKYTFLEVLDEILSILNKIKNLSNEFNITLKTDVNENGEKLQQNIVQEFNDEDIAILEALVADFGIQDIKDTITKHTNELKEQQDKIKKQELNNPANYKKNETKIYEIL